MAQLFRIEDYRSLTGPQKASMFMLAIPQEHSVKLFEGMENEEIRELSQHMSNLGIVDSSIVERLFVEFTELLTRASSLVGSFDTTEKLLRSSLSEDRASAVMDNLQGPEGRSMWEKLNNISEHVLATYLKNEYPQTVAVILTRLSSEQAAKVLTVLPDSLALEVIMRMVRMETVQRDILDHVEQLLHAEFVNRLSRTQRRDNHEVIADIFNSLDRNSESRLMGALEERNRDAAERIKGLMFTFNDLNRISDTDIQVLLRQVEKDQLVIALKGASEEISDLFFRNMSERAGVMLREDMESLGAVRMKDVDAAQSQVVQTAKALASVGEIIIMSDSDDDEMVY